ncbi:MAG TPA: HAD hydrolase-like protein [Candidatus Saccharimonadales bacterium]|nr:HAD hydrolase-like protein [Candidatus Saccharimonadales bacterium]
MASLRPTLCFESVGVLDIEVLQQEIPGLEGVVYDLDKTLTHQHGEGMPNAHLDVIGAINELGLVQGIISNAASEEREERVRVFAKGIGAHIGAEVEVVTSRMVGGKKKPLRPVFDKMSELLDIPNEHLCYIGDQLLKDVLGANRAGYGGSVLVAPYGEGDDPRVRFLQRPVEAVIRPFIGLPFLADNFWKIEH